jgi:hypothetical protein
MRVRLVGPAGEPIARRRVAIEAAGDRFRGPVSPPVADATTDDDGWLGIALPATTHVTLRPDGAGEIGFVPDCADGTTLLAIPRDKVALRVRAAAGELPRTIRATPAHKVNRRGVVLVERDDGEDVEFRLARGLSEREGLYVADARDGASASSRRVLTPARSGGGALPSTIDVDLRGGATNWADLTPLRDR